MVYVFFGLTMLFYIGLALLTASRPNLVGDGAMGYGLGLAFLGMGLTASSLTLTIMLLVKGNFQWLAGSSDARTALVLVAWLCTVLTTFFCAAFKWEWHESDLLPEFLHWLAINHGQIWIPLLWLLACFFSLNSQLTLSLPLNALKGIFYVGLLLSSAYSIGLVVGYLRSSVENANRISTENQQRVDYWHRQVLDEIAAHKPTDSIYGLLSQTTQVRPDDTRAAAVAKVKSHPTWEADLLALLKSEKSYREVYYFLDGNAVDHPQQFAEPLNQSIEWLAEDVKTSIAENNNLQNWTFDNHNIDNLLRAIDGPFLDKGVDFRPNVLRLKQALDTPLPEHVKGVRFTATDAVDAWLRKHGN